MSQPEWVITVDQLKSNQTSVKLVDVRQPEEHAEVAISNSTLIPLGEIGQRALEELRREEDIVLYCAKGMRSLEAALLLKSMGYSKVRSLEGGIEAWLEAEN